MPAPKGRPKARAIRRVPVVRRNVQPVIRRRSPSRSSSSSRSRSFTTKTSSSRSSRSHSRKYKRSHRRRISHRLRRRSNSVIPLYGTSGTVIVGYVRLCRSGVKLCHRNG
ncbi:hypothetical protein X798_07346 [Onchocerca flexuosa]|uniref:Uncharacterized protein n=1 Tax=Onchocerca flexuosa TaxID=387005 RepID=A0A238BJQ5_9BILA|nr:hypothetical protein X798_07346 [Onchocerca flexuosa]